MTSNQSENVPPHPAHPPHYLHELPLEDEERIGEIFNTLDVDGNGKIDIYDLSAALKEFGVSHHDAQKILEKSDSNKSGDISLAEFIHYVKEHEKHLRLSFSHIDKNKDGKIDEEELTRAFKELKIEIDAKEAQKLLQRMDKDGSLEISFNKWRDFLLYCPSTDIRDLIKYWRHSTFLDIGEDINVPDDFTQTEMLTGMWWRHLVAGGVAGAVSRTCTAPLDRLKVHLQVHGDKKTSIRHCFSYLLKEGGVWSLWRGNGINVLKIAPESALKFMAYEQIKRMIRGSNTRDLTIYERFVAGSMAGAFSQTVIYPLEVSAADRTMEQFEEEYEILKSKLVENDLQLSQHQGCESLENTIKLTRERRELNEKLSRLNDDMLLAFLREQSSRETLRPYPDAGRWTISDDLRNFSGPTIRGEKCEILRAYENSSDADDESDGLSNGGRISEEEELVKLRRSRKFQHLSQRSSPIAYNRMPLEDVHEDEESDTINDQDVESENVNRNRVSCMKIRNTSSPAVPLKIVSDFDRRPRALRDLDECDEMKDGDVNESCENPAFITLGGDAISDERLGDWMDENATASTANVLRHASTKLSKEEEEEEEEDTLDDENDFHSEFPLGEGDLNQPSRKKKPENVIIPYILTNAPERFNSPTRRKFVNARSFGDCFFLSKFNDSQRPSSNTAVSRRSRYPRVFHGLLVLTVVLFILFLYVRVPACKNITTNVGEMIHYLLHWNEEWYRKKWIREVKPSRRKRIHVMKTRLLLAKTGQFRSMVDAATKILKREGLRSFYRGYVPNLLGIVPYAGIDLAVYETLKNSYRNRQNEIETPKSFVVLAAGTISSTCGQVCSYPLTLVRTKLQAEVLTNVGMTTQPYTMTRIVKSIIQKDGFSGLYRGITPNFLKVAPAVSISYMVYERCREALGVGMT